MEQNILEKEIGKGKSSREIASSLGYSQSNIKYWLKKYELKTKYKPYNKGGTVELKCQKCGELNPDNFYQPKKRKNYCKKCDNLRVAQLQRDKKKKIVSIMGGCCQRCKYDKCMRSLDIHHIDPSTKDINFSHILNWKWSRILKELKKCVLVCRNCHGEIHAGLVKIQKMTG